VGWCGDRHWVYRRGFGVRQSIGDSQVVKGVTTGAASFAWAALGAAAGEGQLAFGCFATALVIFCLELQHIPALQVLDARHWQHRFADDKPDAKPDQHQL